MPGEIVFRLTQEDTEFIVVVQRRYRETIPAEWWPGSPHEVYSFAAAHIGAKAMLSGYIYGTIL